jgi:DNA polymerase-4
LIRALGQASGASLYELAWGRDYRDVTPNEPDKSISAAETFAQDIDDPEEILQEFLRLTEKAAARLRENGYYAKTISIKVRFADFSTISRSKTLPLPIDSTHEIYEIAKTLYLALNLDRARLRLVGISLDNLSEAAPEQLLLGAREKGWREADTAIDRAKLRFGGGSVRPGRLIRKSSADPKPAESEKSSE